MKGKRRYRPIDGVFLLDKPLGLSSNDALQKVKRLFNAEKAGHTGSLDPLATGLLPLCFGEATKFSQLLLDSDKSYRATMKLGIRTASGDVDAPVVSERPVPVLSDAEVEAILARFRGDIDQVPSMYSALKVDGRPLYELARQGLEIERKARPVSIYRLELLARRDDEWDIEVSCSKGTYIRSLVEDIGEAIGCGAHVTALHRLSAGPFCADQMHTLESLQARAAEESVEALDDWLLPASAAVEGLPRVELSERSAYYLLLGQAVRAQGLPDSGAVSLFEEGGRFLGVGELTDDGRVAPKRLIRTGGQ